MIHYSKCPLCSSENTELHLRTRDHFLSGEEFELFKCASCGFVFTQDHPDENDIGKYYDTDEYLSHNDSATDFPGRLYKLSRSIMLKKKRKKVRWITGLKSGTLLDIGSGTGHFLSVMKDAGWNVKGIEINEKARINSTSRFNLDILSPDQISALSPGTYDCITMWHVLEHFQEPLSYASEILHLLKPGGICITALPNCISYDAGYYKEFWAAYDVPRHLWHFTPSAFSVFMEKTGFNLKRIRNMPLDVFYISALSEKYKGSGFAFMRGMIKGTFFAILSSFNKKRSSSIIYYLVK
jgi:SAM-dependent methyltransferase